MKTKRIRLKHVSILIVVLTGVALVKGYMDWQLFWDPTIYDANCAPPCWKEIRPGLTNKTAALSMINQLIVFPACDDLGFGASGGRISCANDMVYMRYDSRQQVNVLRISQPSTITLAKVLEKFGSPAKVSTFDSQFPDAPNYSDVRLSYPELGMEVVVRNAPQDYSISQNSKPYRIVFATEVSTAFDAEYPWKGFGDYSGN